jgi:hypothetical protein
MTPLAVCPECQRHLRRTETTCPFCSADVRDAFSKMLPRAIPTERLGRTALLAFAAANIGVAACGGDVSTPLYGAPAPDGSISTGGASGGSNTGGASGGSKATGGASGSNTGGMQSGSGGRTATGGASATGGFNTGGVIIVPPYGIAPIPPDSTGGKTGAGGDFGIPIYGASPPKP